MSRLSTKQRRAARRRSRWLSDLTEARERWPHLDAATAVFVLRQWRVMRAVFEAPARRWFHLDASGSPTR
jgi:hypothetical protein